jgi:hypothetical protein
VVDSWHTDGTGGQHWYLVPLRSCALAHVAGAVPNYAGPLAAVLPTLVREKHSLVYAPPRLAEFMSNLLLRASRTAPACCYWQAPPPARPIARNRRLKLLQNPLHPPNRRNPAPSSATVGTPSLCLKAWTAEITTDTDNSIPLLSIHLPHGRTVDTLRPRQQLESARIRFRACFGSVKQQFPCGISGNISNTGNCPPPPTPVAVS